MQFICTNCCLDSTSTAPSEEVSWRQRTGEHMIHLWNATDPRRHHHAWVNLIYLLGLHGGCKCCLPAPTKAHATAGQSRSAMQVSAYLSNITACSLILKILEKILEMSKMMNHNACDFFFFFFLIAVVTASVCSCRSVTNLASCQRWTHHVWLQNGTCSVSV